jgi:hypothetical protein
MSSSRVSSSRGRLASIWAVALVAALATLLFAGLRLVVAAHGDVSRFVVAGSVAVDAATVRPTIHVFDSDGYDGQYYWRLATNPSELQTARYRGVELDSVLRDSRIAYPSLSWLLSFGQAEWVTRSLVAVNVLAVAALAAAGAVLSRLHGRSQWWGLLLASSSGLVMAVSRDLNEATMVAGLVAGVAMLSLRRPGWAALCWLLACLAHEQALLCVVPFAVWSLVGHVRARSWRPTSTDVPWIVALAGFGGWQLWCRAVVGSVPVLASSGASLDLPFKGLVEQTRVWARTGLARQEYLVVPQLALLIVLVVVAFRRARTVPSPARWLPWALAGASLLAVTLSQQVWVGPAELRQFVVLSTLAWVVIVMSPRSIPSALVAATAAVWLLTAVARSVAV